ncbi:hypothetical protein L596_027656 [Steinernema carpocapsae]|uniref:Uncharacterized protein n=1 Tax=Steinernema carpocapsae TaxID=34508 RepID=A0A4U5LW61_STECR|nr:hypothetical protein L596_027656 [Steinernema carpocapsae]
MSINSTTTEWTNSMSTEVPNSTTPADSLNLQTIHWVMVLGVGLFSAFLVAFGAFICYRDCRDPRLPKESHHKEVVQQSIRSVREFSKSTSGEKTSNDEPSNGTSEK